MAEDSAAGQAAEVEVRSVEETGSGRGGCGGEPLQAQVPTHVVMRGCSVRPGLNGRWTLLGDFGYHLGVW